MVRIAVDGGIAFPIWNKGRDRAGSFTEGAVLLPTLQFHLPLKGRQKLGWYSMSHSDTLSSMGFKTMDPALIRELIKDQVDVITPAAEMEAEVYKHSRCPVCGNVGASKVIEPPKIITTEEDGMVVLKPPFSDDSPLAIGHAKCPKCDTEYSPETGVIISQPEPVLTDPHFTDE